MIVELDIFSGQPNPTWELSAEQQRELERRVTALVRQKVPARIFDGLGYRGMIVRERGNPNPSLRVGSGSLVRGDTVYEDPGRAFEAWLVGTGKGKIDERLIGAALESMGKPDR